MQKSLLPPLQFVSSEISLPLEIYLVLPLVILIGGIVFAHFTSSLKRAFVGGVLIALGSIETVFNLNVALNILQYFPLEIVVSLTIGVVTVIIGIISIYKSSKHKL